MLRKKNNELVNCERAVTSESDLEKIQNWGERLFATACLESGCLILHQVQVGVSLIDFLIINPNSKGDGTLVEVTTSTEKGVSKCHRKQRQIRNMEESGMRHTLLSLENLVKISNRGKTKK